MTATTAATPSHRRRLGQSAAPRAAGTRPGGAVWGRKSSFDSGELYSYGPRYTVGSVGPQFRCGGGEGAVHSRVLEFQGFRGAFLPANRLQKKLIAKKICEMPRQI